MRDLATYVLAGAILIGAFTLRWRRRRASTFSVHFDITRTAAEEEGDHLDK